MPYVDRPGEARIHYKDFDLRGDWDPLPGPPVVLIHGLGCTWEVWRRQIGWLAHWRRIIAVDVRGSGQSTTAKTSWTQAEPAADIRNVVESLGIEKPDVVGLSGGGQIALQYAADYPTGLERLVVSGTTPGVPKAFKPLAWKQARFVDTHTIREIAEDRMSRAVSDDADPRLRRWIVDLIGSGNIVGYRAQAHASFDFDIRDRLGQIVAPTTIIHGTEDRTVPVAATDLSAAGIPQNTVVRLAGMGHFPNLESPDEFNAVLGHALGLPDSAVPTASSR